MDFSKTVVFENIADFDFTPDMGAMYGGLPYPVKAGERKVFLYELADHLATHLARQMFLRHDKSARVYDPNDKTGGLGATLWNEAQIQALKAKMMSSVILEDKKPELTEDQKVAAKVAELNAIEPDISPVGYKDKSEVILELQKRGIQFDARQSKAKLEKLLA